MKELICLHAEKSDLLGTKPVCLWVRLVNCQFCSSMLLHTPSIDLLSVKLVYVFWGVFSQLDLLLLLSLF